MKSKAFCDGFNRGGSLRRRLQGVALGILVGGTSLFGLTLPHAAQSQQIEAQALYNRLDRMERDLQTLQRQVYRGQPAPAASAGAPAPLAAEMPEGVATRLHVRIEQLEQQIRVLTGQVEEVSFNMAQVSSRLDKALADIDLRLTEIEQGRTLAQGPDAEGQEGTTPPAAANADAPAVAPAAPPGQLALPSNNAAAGSQAAAAPAGLTSGTPQEKYDYAFSLLRQADYSGAEQALRGFLEAHPDDALAGNAQYWLGETHYVRGEYEQAAVLFLQGYQKYGNGGKAPDSLLKLGLSLSHLGKSKEACAALGRLDREFPQASDAIKRRAVVERQKLACS
ncbi:tol-pal system protein YbgF [Telmatospirillum sp. J64-1]|uniref:tol-pal system protein YbgF n=1 Tax=Telmatospirillum sp. J64-1 TaxID=2502183 RepID=UPI00115CCBFE|nr:tol-pal system protein YbgF [Telmatospirillum sp. J64-1]